MDPCAHGELGDEDIATFREEDWCLSRYHLHIWVCLHNLLDSRQWQLVEFVVMIVGFEVVDYLLPVGRKDITIVTLQTLIYLWQVRSAKW